MARRYWLMKSEPGAYSIADFARDGTDWWTGVRNYQARNFMRQMKKGDGVLFYHSSCPHPGVVGIAEVCDESQTDPTQYEEGGDYYDPRATPERPIWFCPRIRFARELPLIPLSALRAAPGLEGMMILRRGSRLSVTPVSAAEWQIITRDLAGKMAKTAK